MLAVNALDVDINGTPILRDVGLSIDKGEIIGLIGRNGAGKTTFLRSIMGLLPVVSGSVAHEGQDIKNQPGYKRAHMGFGYMPEDRKLVPEMTAEQNILVPVWSTGIDGYTKLYRNVRLLEICLQRHCLVANRSLSLSHAP